MVEVSERGVVAVTLNGQGSWWLFPSWKAAFEHPLIQYGDPICQGPRGIELNWTMTEIPDLLDQLVTPVERANILMEIKSVGWNRWTVIIDRYRDMLFGRMVDKCNEPPADPKTVFDLIVRDRRTPTKEYKTMAKNPTATTESTESTAADQTTATAEGDAPAAEKGTTKRQPPVREPKYKADAKITLLADKDGNAYSKDNNPKRAGSASAARFANYVNGMTVEQALAAGLTRGDLDFDIQKKYIAIA